jgi:hypothetical protein
MRQSLGPYKPYPNQSRSNLALRVAVCILGGFLAIVAASFFVPGPGFLVWMFIAVEAVLCFLFLRPN